MRTDLRILSIFICLLTTLYSKAQKDQYDFYPYQNDNGWGLMYRNGEKLFEDTYDQLITYDKNRIRVIKNGLWGVIDSTGKVLIPTKYAHIENDQFGYRVFSHYSDDLVIGGFLSMTGDTIIPFGPYSAFTREIGNNEDFLLLLMDDERIEAIYSSDGVQRTGFDFENVYEIDSLKFMKSSAGKPTYYFALETTDKKYGVYGGLEKRIIVEPIYDYVCFGWCSEPLNPHFRSGPVIYTGSTPAFTMVKDDHPVVIKKNGELLFETDTINVSKFHTRYYLSEMGDLTTVEGKCVEHLDLPPPYVMKDDKGFFMLNKDGSYFEGEKIYHDEIVKGRCLKDRTGPMVIIIKDHGKAGLMDSVGHWVFEQKYEYVSCPNWNNTAYYMLKESGKDPVFYNLQLNRLEHAPGTVRKPPYIAKHNGFYGVLGEDSIWLVKPQYNSFSNRMDRQVRGLKGYIFQKENEGIELLDTTYKVTHHFETKNYLLKGNYYINDQEYLILYDSSKVSIYDLENENWIIKDKPYQIWLGGTTQQLDSTIYFFLQDKDKNLYVLDTMGETIFTTSFKDFYNIAAKLERHSEKLILRTTYYNEDNGVVLIKFQNEEGANIDITDGANDGETYLSYHAPTHTFIVGNVYAKRPTYVFDSSFNFVRRTMDRIVTHDSFYTISNGRDQIEYPIYISPDSILFTIKTSWINRMRDSRSTYAYTDSGYVLLNAYTIVRPLNYYHSDPIYLDKSGLFIMRTTPLDPISKYDVFLPSGELIFEDVEFVSQAKQFYDPKYYVFEKDGEQYWLTKDGFTYYKYRPK